MFTCSYCGTQFLEHKPNCPNCGAAIRIAPSQPNEAEAVPTDLYKICDSYQENYSLYFDDSIGATRLKNAVSRFNIPLNEKVIMLYDDTVLNANNKLGFAICSQGIYWKNDWTVETKRTYLPWSEFSNRAIKLDNLQVDLGKGDRIGVAGCGSVEVREKIVKMLKEIQQALH